MNLTDPKQDDRIREALRSADKKGRLGVVAAVAGIAGGEKALREIMNSTGELLIMNRGMLAIHLA
jgi:DNA transposition AAA+ family ATPase